LGTIMGESDDEFVVTPVPNAAAVVITGKTSRVRQCIDLISEIDLSSRDVPTRFFKLRHAEAEDLAETLNKIFRKPPSELPAGDDRGGVAQPVPVQIVPDIRTNRIFVMGRPSELRVIGEIIREFDTKPTDRGFFRRKLRSVDAVEFLDLAEAALKMAFEIDGEDGVAGEKQLTSADDTPEALIVGRTLLVADTVTNSLVFQGNCRQVEFIIRLIDLVDGGPDEPAETSAPTGNR
jgi:type II secretory pathway component GspD/PulD (secretin)